MNFYVVSEFSDLKTVVDIASMKKAIDFRYAYGNNGFYERVLGLCASKGETWIESHRAWAWIFVLVTCCVMPQVSALSIMSGDLNLFIGCLCTTLSMGLATAKVAFLHRKRIVIGYIYDTMVKDWDTIKTPSEMESMSEVATISRLLSIISVYICNILFVTHAANQLWPMIKSGREYYNRDPRIEFGFILPSYFRFDTSNKVVWVSLWLGQLLSSILSIIAYSGPDCFASLAVLHLCGQLRLLRNALKNIVDETTIKDPRIYWQRLNTIVERHEELIRFGFVIRRTFSPVLLVKVVMVTIIFCFEVYAIFTNLMDRNGAPIAPTEMVFSVVYAVFTSLHLFAYCYSGDRLTVESSKVSDDFYETAWYELAPKEARAFLFVCHRTKTPLELTAGDFCTFNMELFNGMMKNSMGYLSMLTAMKDRLVD